MSKISKMKKTLISVLVLVVAGGIGFTASEIMNANNRASSIKEPQKEKKTSSKYSSKKSSVSKKRSSSSTSNASSSVSDNQNQVSQTQADATEQTQASAESSSIQTAIDPADMDAAQRAEYDAFSARAATAQGPIGQAGPVDENGDPIYGPTHYDDDGNIVPGEADDDSDDSGY